MSENEQDITIVEKNIHRTNLRRLIDTLYLFVPIALAFAGMSFIMFHLTTSDVVNNVAGSGISVVSVALSIFMMLLEILVSYIQALVFTMLSAVFISFAHVKEHE